MKSYNERVQKHRDNYDNMVRREGILEEVADKINHLIPYDKLEGDISNYVTYLYYETKDMEKLELEIIPTLSEMFNLTWTKRVDETLIIYTSSVDYDGESFYINLCLLPENSCKIVAKPTGKMQTISKWVEVEVPEVEYVVDCEEDSYDN